MKIKNNSEENGKIILETGTYEIIRHRLDKFGKELRYKINLLNDERRTVFGSADAALIATERIITENACIPADMKPIGNKFIFGYNIDYGIKKISPEDVFSVYSYSDLTFHTETLELISDPTFISDFNDLYKYYKETRFIKFSQIGKSQKAIKVFKWIVDGNNLKYIDNRSEHEFKFPKQHEFKWKKTRDMHIEGKHSHVSIENILFVETIEGDLTIKSENNTNSGEGVYAEDVDIGDQTLDDADFHYSVLGDIVILKIRPYQEKNYRYIVYSAKTKTAVRIDAIKEACVLLPENQGIIFSNGYYLQTGDYKFFDSRFENLIFERKIISPNGEDFIYTFYENNTGVYVLLKYNLIEQQIETPVICNGFSIFENGEMCNFRDDGETKNNSDGIYCQQAWNYFYENKRTSTWSQCNFC